MKTNLLSVSLTLPMLMIGIGQSLASTQVINQEHLQIYRPAAKTAQAALTKPTTLPFYLAARDEQKKECEWVGICK
jgi:hypothetical protein